MERRRKLALAEYFCRFARYLPLRLCSDVGALLAVVLRRADPDKHAQMKALIAALRPDLATTPRKLEQAARRVWSATARNYAELPILLRKLRAGHLTIRGEDILASATTSGKPVILLFVHTGNWELMGQGLALRYPGRILAIYAPFGDAEETAIIMRMRGVSPAELAPMSPFVWRRALEHLRKPGAILWVAADEWEDGVVRTPFFGRPPRYDGNISKAVRLSRRTGAIVVPLYSERHARDRIRTTVLPATHHAEGDPDDDLRADVDKIEAQLSRRVTELLDQWYLAPHVGEPVPPRGASER